mmetsp:Transcript_54921/g.158924  ORF Transcript_54921/g.158924 Transcript_54921/m.158924 type:complete len:1012 (-) Transcript_54921:131-3166(-)|eukprot:CAMPEP_0176052350 /NCGR_PEP_ID=MMETSP0120_2-20121206/26028_1 /TAXON_ID=160619 /ORGANISM="Kryptoperidinium foliaceum, Strain CCMP 1326" /LENGTH=1011 /DNA_ID=CAMNT_0017385789 /DNA_START=96 /DNA_END=3131 /DNA_ORIENTATION=+
MAEHKLEVEEAVANSPSPVLHGDSSFQLKLEKDGGIIGFAYQADRFGLLVTGIVADSPVDRWNKTSDAGRALCPGDVIIGVNAVHVKEEATSMEEADCEAVVEELLHCDGACVLTVCRFGPRWHLQGIVAESMEMVELRGVDMELVELDHLFTDDNLTKDAECPKVKWTQFAWLLFVVALPSILVVAFCSDIGTGFALFSTFAGSMMNMGGNLVILLSAFGLIGLYVVEWDKWESKAEKVVCLLILIYGMALGGFFRCRSYPQAPMVILLFHIPIAIGVLRLTVLKQVNRASFYRSIGLALLIVGLSVIIVWLAWMNIDSGDGNNQYNDATKAKLVQKSEVLYAETKITISGRSRSLDYNWDCKLKVATDFDVLYSENVDNGVELTSDEKKARELSCSQVKTIWFLVWVSPLIVCMTNLVISAFCLINGTLGQADDMTKTETALKTFVSMVVVVLLCMWVAASIAGASMQLTGTIMAFSGAGLVALFLWIYFEVGSKLIHSTLKQSKIMGQLMLIVTNDWFRACCLLGPGALLPAMFGIEVLKQKVRILRGGVDSGTLITPESAQMLGFLLQWDWVGILMKANWLVILYWTLSVGVSKVTVVFLSWLNEEFEKNLGFDAVLVIFFIIGFTMFMLPPVPGIPVYITAGIIIAAQGRSIEGVGFGGGIAIAIIESLVLKLCACCGQYSIGYFLGKVVKIQQLVGVDKVPIRAIEKILLKRGLSLGKVSVLVGGPDWPTSVLTGILKLNLPQCCLGTLPVIFVSSPCVLAGAFLAGPKAVMTDSEKGVWDALSSTMLLVSFVGQLASGILAMYFIQDKVMHCSEELSAHRPEHDAVKQLTLAEMDFNECCVEVCDWRTFTPFWLRYIVATTGMMIGAFFAFIMMDSMCFRAFEVNNKISDPEGLDCGSNFGCAVLRIVRWPLGWFALAAFFVASIMHIIFVKHISIKTKQRYQYKKDNGLLGRTSRRKSSVKEEVAALMERKSARISEQQQQQQQQDLPMVEILTDHDVHVTQM